MISRPAAMRCRAHRLPLEVILSSLELSAIVFGCISAGALIGVLLRYVLPEHHLAPESKDVVKLGMGLIGTMSALVLGLLVASAKSSFDTQRNGLAQMSGNIVFLDRLLARYGPESKDARQYLRDAAADMLERTWPTGNSPTGQPAKSEGTEGRYEGLFDTLQGLSPKTEAQRSIQSQALKIATDIAQSRWSLFAQRGSSISTQFLVVMASWLGIVFASFTLYAPPNATVLITLLICALVISSTVFLILELDRPFDGFIRVSSEPLQRALAQLGR
jgi:hypothetical protein